MKKKRSKDLAAEADAALIAKAEYFTVVRFVGRDPRDPGPILRSKIWDRTECPTLEAARALRDALGVDSAGRRGVIYAVAPGNLTVHVE